ncbi:MAG: hypothetical protein GWN00_16320 [Aliifodinibius sp.]|nr:hypothetical protein [Fodinibius sp.]NIY26313.1 hypothetical protein [Fodinibius sp.]
MTLNQSKAWINEPQETVPGHCWVAARWKLELLRHIRSKQESLERKRKFAQIVKLPMALVADSFSWRFYRGRKAGDYQQEKIRTCYDWRLQK